MALGPFALFIMSDSFPVDHLNCVLVSEAAYVNHLLEPVVEPDFSDPYSVTPRRLCDPTSGAELPAAQHQPPVSADLLTRAKNSFLGATLEGCAAYLRASAFVDPAWDMEMFAVLDEGYLTHATVLVAHSYVAGDDKTTYAPDHVKCFHDGVQAYPCEKGTVLDHMSLRTGLDFQEDLERYERICKSSGVEIRSIGVAWDLFKERKDENATI